MRENSLRQGMIDGIPIALGYLSVSFSFGILASKGGLPVWVAVLISMTNLTSAGQFAGLDLILSGGSLIEMALTQLIINLRYALMSLSLSQKLDSSVRLPDRLIISFGNTDEVFAVASSKSGDVGRRYLYGLISLPYVGWALGTFLGAAAGQILPAIAVSALGIALYGMFVAIIIPPAKKYRPVLKVIIASVALSCIIYWTPLSTYISSGFSIILCALLGAGIGATLYPISREEQK